MGVLIFSSHAWIDYLEHHGVCTPDLGAHWPEDGWQGWRKTGPSLGPDSKGQASVGHQEGRTGTWLGSAHITAHRSACIWWTHLLLDFSPDFLQGLLLRFRQGQLGGDRIALGNQGPLLLLCQDQGAWSLQFLCRPRSRKGSKRSSRAHWREASWGQGGSVMMSCKQLRKKDACLFGWEMGTLKWKEKSGKDARVSVTTQGL